jgi:nitroimidazol reductase NimA-like FMN-containing flavoprotein (pyridoxamine 5'-phosphate oxidase superfamily)
VTDAWLETLTDDECLDLLRVESVGRVAVISEECPVVLPVNYRLVETTDRPWIALRSRPGNVIDQTGSTVAFEIDHIDTAERRGWSVLVRGVLQHVNPDAGFAQRFDSQPWLLEARDAWLVIEPTAISGRRLQRTEAVWSFHLSAYL